MRAFHSIWNSGLWNWNSKTARMNPSDPASFSWGEAEIRWLYAKLTDMDQKMSTTCQDSSCRAKVQGLDVRLGMLEGKVNMLERISFHMEEVEQQQRKGSFRHPSEAVSTIIKEESFEFGGSAQFDEEPGDEDWYGLFTADAATGSTDDSSGKNRGQSKRTTRSRLKKSKPRALKPVEGKKSAASEAPAELTITPDTDLINKSKELLGDIQADAATGKFQCPECAKQFCHKKDVTRHYFVHSGIKPYLCTKCPETFSRGDKLIKHIKMYHMEGENWRKELEPAEFHCKLCPETRSSFSNRGKLAEHYTKHHEPPAGMQPLPEVSLKCSTCAKPFVNSKDLAAHEQTHDIHIGKLEVDRRHNCEACPQTFSRRSGLVRHRLRAHSTPSEAEEARRVKREANQAAKIRSPIAINRHRITKKRGASGSFPCPDCAKVFTIRHKLKTHLISCRGLKPFKCEDCGRGFAQKAAMQAHRANVHQRLKRFLCPDCGMCFFNSTSYKRHIRCHRGIKPYACKQCDRCFTAPSDLRRHEMIHTGIKKIQCSVCDLKFYRGYTLKRHMLVHTGERPFMCDICGMSFSQSGSLKKHKECHARPGGGGPVRGLLCQDKDRRKPREEVMRRESRLLKQMKARQAEAAEAPTPTPPPEEEAQPELVRIPIPMSQFPTTVNADFISAFATSD